MPRAPALPTDGNAGPEMPMPVAGRWPLRGRERELRRALGALEAGRGAVLVGEPGVGKTRLAHEVVEAARLRGHPVRWAAATQAARPIAFGALAHLVPSPAPGGASRLSLLQRALGELASAGGDRGLVLGVDDAHLLDESSSALVHLAASAANVRVVATSRADADGLEPVTSLWKEGLAERIEVRPLTQDEVTGMAGDILGGGLDRRTAQLLWRVTLGNPLYLREVLLGGLDGGQLRRSGGLWRWRGELRTGSRLAEVVRVRLGDLGDELRSALEVVAVANPIELSMVEQLCGEGLVREAERRGIVTIVRDGRRNRVELFHPLYAEVLKQGIPEHRVERIMGRLAGALEATGARRRGDLLRSCDWRLQAGLPVPDGVLLAAATQARETGDWLLMERLLAPVSREGASDQARLVLGDALLSVGRWAEAESVMAGLDVSRLSERDAAEATILRLDNLTFHLGRLDQVGALLDRYAGAPGGPPPWLGYARAWVMSARGDVVAARAVLPEREAESLGPDWSAMARLTLAAMASASGDVDGALAIVDRALVESGETTAYGVRRSLMASRLWLAVLGGYFDQAPLESIYAAAAASGDRLGIWFTASLAGMVSIARGDAPAARQWAAELSGLAPGIPSGAALAVGHAMRACLLALVGETEAAAAALADAEAVRQSEIGAYEFDLARARYTVAAAQGDVRLAQALALAAADRALELGQHVAVLAIACDAARLGMVAAAAELVERVAGGMTGRMLPRLAEGVLAWRRSDAAGLDALSQEYAAMGMYLAAAEAATTAAHLHREAGRRTAAAVSGARAAGLADRCAGCRSPVLASGPRISPLTARELQSARLAAQGLSNRRIAARLGISTRTVESHLQHAYGKLGVTSRAHLGPALDAWPRPE